MAPRLEPGDLNSQSTSLPRPQHAQPGGQTGSEPTQTAGSCEYAKLSYSRVVIIIIPLSPPRTTVSPRCPLCPGDQGSQRRAEVHAGLRTVEGGGLSPCRSSWGKSDDYGNNLTPALPRAARPPLPSGACVWRVPLPAEPCLPPAEAEQLGPSSGRAARSSACYTLPLAAAKTTN